MNRKKALPAVQADFNVKDTKLVLPFQWDQNESVDALYGRSLCVIRSMFKYSGIFSKIFQFRWMG